MAFTHSVRLPLLRVRIDSRASLYANTEISAAHFSMFFFLNNRGRVSKQLVNDGKIKCFCGHTLHSLRLLHLGDTGIAQKRSKYKF